jgi:hypothetical protein
VQINQGLLEVNPGVEETKRTNNFGESRKAQALGLKVGLERGFANRGTQVRQQVAQFLPFLPPSGQRGISLQEQAEIVPQSPVYRFGKGKWEYLRRRLAFGHASTEWTLRKRGSGAGRAGGSRCEGGRIIPGLCAHRRN